MIFDGFYRVQITAADLPAVITQISLSGLELQNIEIIDALTASIRIKRNCLEKVKQIILKNGGTYKVVNEEGLIWKIRYFFKHPVLVLGILLYILAAIMLPKHILFVKVTGNWNVPVQYILSKAEEYGLKFGSLASEIRSEEIKNQLMENIPQLQWVGISLDGCVVTIQVSERSSIQENPLSNEVSNIISVCDGVISDQIVYNGSPLFCVGDAVKKGDVLVSGYIDCGLKYRACQAKADVFGLTKRRQEYISIDPSVQRGKIERIHTCYRLRIGKKVINFCNHSGIMDSDCVKMYVEDCWSFPGNFCLPISSIKVTFIDREISTPMLNSDEVSWLRQFAQKYLNSVMISGKILSEDLKWERIGTGTHMTGIYACHELIGREIYEGTME